MVVFESDLTVHLAWDNTPDFWKSKSDQNLKSSCGLIDFILKKASCKKFIVAGSCAEYGNRVGSYLETDKRLDDSCFSDAKCSLQQHAELKCQKRDIDLVWFRIFYAYGPNHEWYQ